MTTICTNCPQATPDRQANCIHQITNCLYPQCYPGSCECVQEISGIQGYAFAYKNQIATALQVIFPFVGAAALAKYALFFSKRKVQEIRAMLPAKEECLRKIAIAALKTGIVATVVAIPSAFQALACVCKYLFSHVLFEGVRGSFSPGDANLLPR